MTKLSLDKAARECYGICKVIFYESCLSYLHQAKYLLLPLLRDGCFFASG